MIRCLRSGLTPESRNGTNQITRISNSTNDETRICCIRFRIVIKVPPRCPEGAKMAPKKGAKKEARGSLKCILGHSRWVHTPLGNPETETSETESETKNSTQKPRENESDTEQQTNRKSAKRESETFLSLDAQLHSTTTKRPCTTLAQREKRRPTPIEKA